MRTVIRFLITFIVILLLAVGAWAFFMPKDDGIFHVVLDPGHGGKDPGAVIDELYEKDINLAVALLVRKQLKNQENLTVSMTRADDSYLTLSERADFANQVKADLYVSIHSNSLEDEAYSGIFTFYHPMKPRSKISAEIIQNTITAISGGINRGVRSGDYEVLRETKMSAVLVELGFMTCPEELELLVDPEYQEKLAQGITAGIIKYMVK